MFWDKKKTQTTGPQPTSPATPEPTLTVIGDTEKVAEKPLEVFDDNKVEDKEVQEDVTRDDVAEEESILESPEPTLLDDDQELEAIEKRKQDILRRRQEREEAEAARILAEEEARKQHEQEIAEVQEPQQVPLLVSEFDMLKILYEKINDLQLRMNNIEIGLSILVRGNKK